MIKKFIIFLFIFFGFVANAYASSVNYIIPVTALLTKNIDLNKNFAKKLTKTNMIYQYNSTGNLLEKIFIYKKNSFEVYDSTGTWCKNLLILKDTSIFLYDSTGTKIEKIYKYENGVVYEYDSTGTWVNKIFKFK